MPLQWSILLLCLSANANNMALVKSGENFTVKCSTERCSTMGCSTIVEDHDGMYLYRGLVQPEEVLYYHPRPGSKDKITLRRNYWFRVQTQGTMNNNTITISNLTVNDTGIYTCVYHKFPHNKVLCNVHILIVNEELPCPRQVESPEVPATYPTMPCLHESNPPLVLIITVTCAFATLVAVIFALLIVPRVKRCIESRGGGRKPQASTDYVYEEMRRNGFQRPTTTVQSSPHP